MKKRDSVRVPKPALSAFALALALAAAGCGTEPVESPAAAGPSPAAATSTAPSSEPAEKKPVPKNLTFAGTTLEGAKFDAASLAGKPAILWFWAPWCATCASEAQSIGDLKDEYGDRLQILGIAGMGKPSEMKRFVADFELQDVPHLNDAPGKLWKRFGIVQQSWYVFLDADGEETYKGYLDDLQLTQRVQEMTA
ncbi:redoxin domain-containing protein [Actinoplanes sp. G11-F43]|uniref:redoxin domain-containing protein n=1 Tax=Actinoplanes sp. G11-F43 TaxID=3424130 RepID=UPI003D34854C